jgi:hypothetical protein
MAVRLATAASRILPRSCCLMSLSAVGRYCPSTRVRRIGPSASVLSQLCTRQPHAHPLRKAHSVDMWSIRFEVRPGGEGY